MSILAFSTQMHFVSTQLGQFDLSLLKVADKKPDRQLVANS